MKRISDLIHKDNKSIEHYQLYSPNFINFENVESMEFVYSEIYKGLCDLNSSIVVDVNAKRCDLGYYLSLKTNDIVYQGVTDEFFKEIALSKYKDIVTWDVIPNIINSTYVLILNDIEYNDTPTSFENLCMKFNEVMNVNPSHVVAFIPLSHLTDFSNYVRNHELFINTDFKITVYKKINLIKIVL